ncbi:hypothetical protein [Streptomyces mirabilis]|uniref:hypothetical protein n=1 Tax=Streptomyces mirabilis TaxID=68239 RepID=UPI0036DF7656
MTGWQWYWLAWIGVGFLAPETYALFTEPQNTLSETVWSWFGVMKNQQISQWSVQHYLLLAFVIWLAGHMAFRIWR